MATTPSDPTSIAPADRPARARDADARPRTLFVLRHAKAGWDAGAARDFDRPINPRGQAGARLIGAAFRARGFTCDAIVASPAVRVAQTLALFVPAAGLDAVVHRQDRRIYLASSATLLDMMRDWPDDAPAVLLAGHNPGLEDLILDTVPETDAASSTLRAQVFDKFPTGALARLDFAATRWADAASGTATLTALVRPRDLDASLGPEAD